MIITRKNGFGWKVFRQSRDLQILESAVYRTLFAFPDISVTVASLCNSPLLNSCGWGAGSSDNIHSGDSLQVECRATVLGVFLQVSISEAELIEKQSPGPTKQHVSEAMATPGKSNKRTNSHFMGISLIWVLRGRLMLRCIQPLLERKDENGCGDCVNRRCN